MNAHLIKFIFVGLFLVLLIVEFIFIIIGHKREKKEKDEYFDI